jgi:hypothetical protein
MKTQHQNPLFGHKGHEISKKISAVLAATNIFEPACIFNPKFQHFIPIFTKFSLCYREQYVVERFIHNILSTSSHYANAGGDALK